MNALKKLAFAACVVAAGFSTSASAALIGDTITASGGSITPGSAVIGAGNEFSISNAIFFNFDATTLTITTPNNNQGASWSNLGLVVFSGFDDIITGVTFASEQTFGVSGKTDFVNDLAFDTHSITFNLTGGASQNKNSALVFNIATAPASGGLNAVPEPTTVALLGLGLLGFAASRRKSAKSKNA